MSFPSAAIWNCRSGFGICLRHTTTFSGTADARRKRTLFQASPKDGRTDCIPAFRNAFAGRNHRVPQSRGEIHRRFSLEVRRERRFGAGVLGPAVVPSAERLSQDADPHASVEGRLPSARGDAGPHRVHVPGETPPPSILDALRVGGRRGTHGVRREGAAPRRDEGARAVHGGRRVLPLERQRKRTPVAVGRRAPSDAVPPDLTTGIRGGRLGEDAAPLVRFDDAGDRHDVCGLAHVDLLRLSHVPDPVEGAHHDAFELLIDVWMPSSAHGATMSTGSSMSSSFVISRVPGNPTTLPAFSLNARTSFGSNPLSLKMPPFEWETATLLEPCSPCLTRA